MKNVVIGCDPGEAGGIAVLDGQGVIEVHKMPKTFPDIYELLKDIQERFLHENVTAYMENVGHGMPGQSSKATATFARHNGHLEMAFYSLGIKTEMVTPQKWMKHYSNAVGKSSDYEKTVWKNRLKAEAQRLFPKVKVTLAISDAILIANYGLEQLWKRC